MQYQQQGGNAMMGGFGSESFSGLNANTLASGLQLAGQMGAYQAQLQGEAQGKLGMFKYYFNVSNLYVARKLKLLLVPFRHQNWVREVAEDGESYRPPREDINAPDLYIPLMAFVTYVLVISFVKGTAFQFTPEVLASTASTGFAVTGFEVMLLKFGFYLLNAFTVPVLDIAAYSGYKYVGATLGVLTALFLGTTAFYLVTIYTALMAAVYMRNTLRLVFPDPAVAGYHTGSTSSRKYFLLGVSILQVLSMIYLSYTTTLVG